MDFNSDNIFNSPTNYYDQIIQHIFYYVNPPHLLKLKEVSKKFQSLCPLLLFSKIVK